MQEIFNIDKVEIISKALSILIWRFLTDVYIKLDEISCKIGEINQSQKITLETNHLFLK